MKEPNLDAVDFERCVAFYRDGADGEADPDLARWLEDNPATAQRARRHAAIQQHVQGRYDPVLDEPIPRRLLMASQHAPARWPARIGAVATIVLALSGVWWLQGGSSHQQDTGSPISATVATATSEHLPTGAGHTKAVQAPDLTRQGYKLVATRTMQTITTPILEFIYMDRQGQRVRIYAQPEPEPMSQGQGLSGSGVARIHWQQDGVNYVLIGDSSHHSLQRLARAATNASAQPVSGQRSAPQRMAQMHPTPASTRNKPETITPVIRGTQSGSM